MTITLATAEGLFDVLEGSLCLALEGASIATLELPVDIAPALGPATLLVADGNDDPILFIGTLDFAHANEGRTSVTWLGGAGGLGGNTLATHYTAAPTPVPRADIIIAIALAAGETLSAASSLPTDTLPRWTRVAGETWAKALRRALEGTGLGWRILDDGTLWVGAESWPLAELGGVELDEDVVGRVVEVAYSQATLRPGTATAGGRRVFRVTFGADGGAAVELDDDGTGADALAALLAPRLPVDSYARVWTAEVITQNEDGTLDLRAVDEPPGAPFEDLPRVPYDTGLQGGRYVLPQGAYVRVRFLGARPEGALAFGRPTSVAATKGVARLGDHGATGTLEITAAAAGLLITYAPPGGAAVTIGTIAGAVSGSPVVFTGAVRLSLETLLDKVSEEVFLQ